MVDVFELAGAERPEISILSDEFLDRVTAGLAEPVVGVALLKRILSDELRVRSQSNQMQAKLFSEQIDDVLARYEARQLTSGEVIERLVELARKLREARRRNEVLGLTVGETAFYDAVAGGSDDWTADPKLAEIARALVAGIREDLSVDWADHEATEAAIRAKIKRLLRRLGYTAPGAGAGAGGGGRMPERVLEDILEQARVLYRFWPETPVSEPSG